MRWLAPIALARSIYTGLNTTFIQGVPDKGGIGFVSQSGAVAGGVVDFIRNRHVGFSNFSSLGNEADVTETDVIEYLSTDPHTRVIAAYVEMIRDGQRFMEVARRVTQHKPVLQSWSVPALAHAQCRPIPVRWQAPTQHIKRLSSRLA